MLRQFEASALALLGLARQGDEYNDGEILDPKTGRIYRDRPCYWPVRFELVR